MATTRMREVDPTANFVGRQCRSTASRPTPGLYNVHGNVWEWTEDCWNGSNMGNPGDSRARTTGNCSQRVVRGGSWNDIPHYLRSARRLGGGADNRISSRGFRMARMLNP